MGFNYRTFEYFNTNDTYLFKSRYCYFLSKVEIKNKTVYIKQSPNRPTYNCFTIPCINTKDLD